uniref:Uncharacterized protein n=1 Tax=Arundo donax TaxID=35708 RepID=A0A0A9EMV7_ARUDO
MHLTVKGRFFFTFVWRNILEKSQSQSSTSSGVDLLFSDLSFIVSLCCHVKRVCDN